MSSVIWFSDGPGDCALAVERIPAVRQLDTELAVIASAKRPLDGRCGPGGLRIDRCCIDRNHRAGEHEYRSECPCHDSSFSMLSSIANGGGAAIVPQLATAWRAHRATRDPCRDGRSRTVAW